LIYKKDPLRNVKKIAELLGAQVVAEEPETGGGAFGAARLDEIISALQARLRSGQGKRPGQSSDLISRTRPANSASSAASSTEASVQN
jgi:hypothetical protein